MILALVGLALAATGGDLRPLKPALDLDGNPTWPWVAGLLLAGLAGVVLWRWWRRDPAPATPAEILSTRLDLAVAAHAAGDLPAFADAVDAAVRDFVAATTDIPALHLTTGELLDALAGELPSEVHDRVAALLHTCDTVRFAAQSPELSSDLAWTDDMVDALTHTSEPEPQVAP